jgi:hypothetical protein
MRPQTWESPTATPKTRLFRLETADDGGTIGRPDIVAQFRFWPVACRHGQGAALNHLSQPPGRALMHDVSPLAPGSWRMREGLRVAMCSLAQPRLLSNWLERLFLAGLDPTPLHSIAWPQRRSTDCFRTRKPDRGSESSNPSLAGWATLGKPPFFGGCPIQL